MASNTLTSAGTYERHLGPQQFEIMLTHIMDMVWCIHLQARDAAVVQHDSLPNEQPESVRLIGNQCSIKNGKSKKAMSETNTVVT